MPPIKTTHSKLTLVSPNIQRDAPISVRWLQGKTGRNTLRSMGVPEAHITAPTLDSEKQRLADLLDASKHLTWMLQYDGAIVGVIWLDLTPSEHLPAPALNIMIGDPSMRGRGIGAAATHAIIQHLASNTTYTHLYARHLADNHASKALLKRHDFTKIGDIYTDNDKLKWQNVQLKLNTV